MCKNFRRQHPLTAEIQIIENNPLGWVYIDGYNFFVSGPKLTEFFPPYRGGDVVDNAIFRLSFSGLVPEIFVIKVESCPKQNRIFHVFCNPKFCSEDPFQKLYPRDHGYFSSRRAVKFHEVIATSPKVIGVNSLNFKPNFKCSPLKFVGNPRPRL